MGTIAGMARVPLMGAAFGVALGVMAVLPGGCGPACRAVEARPLSLSCADASPFLGELHFDDAATFESFLELDCLQDADSVARGAVVRAVDFTTEAVFVAVGRRAQGARCLAARAAETVEVCDTGLRVGFDDEEEGVESATDSCGGKWTVALALPRAELRAAIMRSL